jgi:hypothetical protein
MATGNVRSRASGVALSVELDGFDRTAREFRAVRQRVKRELVEVERQAAEQPRCSRTPSARPPAQDRGESLGAHLVVRKRASGPYLTTNLRGMRARAAGLIEFGGTVRTPIVPQAQEGAADQRQPPRDRPQRRHYRAHHYLQDAASERLGEFGEHVRDAIVDFFNDPFEIR